MAKWNRCFRHFSSSSSHCGLQRAADLHQRLFHPCHPFGHVLVFGRWLQRCPGQLGSWPKGHSNSPKMMGTTFKSKWFWCDFCICLPSLSGVGACNTMVYVGIITIHVFCNEKLVYWPSMRTAVDANASCWEHWPICWWFTYSWWKMR